MAANARDRRAFIRLLRSGLPGTTALAAATTTFYTLVPGVAHVPVDAAIASVTAFEAIALNGLGNVDGGNSQQSENLAHTLRTKFACSICPDNYYSCTMTSC